jgi:hypothetical protein
MAGLLAGGASMSEEGLFLEPNPLGFSFSTGFEIKKKKKHKNEQVW